MKIILPFVSVVNDDGHGRFAVTVYDEGVCEFAGDGICTADTTRFGDVDPNSPVFCAKHFHSIHVGEHQQSHLEPMCDGELKFFGITANATAGIQSKDENVRRLRQIDRIARVVNDAFDAFWEVVVSNCPTGTSGDLSPLNTAALEEAGRKAVAEWIENNCR